MKNLSILTGLLLTTLAGQVDAQQFSGTIKKTSTNEIGIYMTPTTSSSGSTFFSNLSYTVAFPATSSAGVTATLTPESTIGGSFLTVSPLPPETFGTERVFAFTLQGLTPGSASYTAGTEFLAAKIRFSGNPGALEQIKLISYEASGGAASGQAYYYVELNGSDVTAPTKFYASGGQSTIGSNAGTGDPYAITTSTVSLPVNLLAFTAQRSADRQVQLKWTVGQEENLSYYAIERSLDGRSFDRVIATVPAAGLSGYSGTDLQPVLGANYYRLKMVDVSGATKYSPIREVAFTNTSALISTAPVLYPNPAHLSTTLEYNAPEAFAATIQVYDLMGRLILNQQADFHAGINQHTIDVAGLAAGEYMVKVKGDATNQVLKFQKAN